MSQTDLAFERYGFHKLIDDKKQQIPAIVSHMAVALELFYGQTPHISDIKTLVKELVRTGANPAVQLGNINEKLLERILDRTADEMCKITEEQGGAQ